MSEIKKLKTLSEGMIVKDKYEDVVDFLENNNDKIVYPDRSSKFIRNSFTLSFLDDFGQTMLEEQQINEMKQK